jgi:hypothetical protein
MTPQELDALEVACNIVKTIAEDDMCSSAFESTTGYAPDALESEIGELIDFIHNFGE